MKSTLPLALGLCWLVLSACGSAPRADLAQNRDLYQPTGYVTKLPGDRTAFVGTVQDSRAAAGMAREASVGGYPAVYDGDDRWEAPVAVMVDAILREELAESGLFAAMRSLPKDADLILEPSLVAFRTAAVEELTAGRALAEVGLRLRVHGPAAEGGERPVLFDETLVERKLTDPAFRTTSRHVLAGACLRAVMLRALQTIDGNNLSRDGMPKPMR